MPNKTIYVAEDDLPVFERAQTLAGGNLSSAIAHALRRFVEQEDARREGFQEVTVRVGRSGAHVIKQFWGRRLARWIAPQPDAERVQILGVYRTRRGRYAVHRRESSRAAWWSNPAFWTDPAVWKDPQAWREILSWDGSDASLEVYESLDELAAHIPEDLWARVAEANRQPPLEILDL